MAVHERLGAVVARLSSLAHRPPREGGQGMVEYAVIAMMIAIGLTLVVSVIGKQTTNMYSNISNALGP